MPRELLKRDILIRKDIGFIKMEVFGEELDFDNEMHGQGMRALASIFFPHYQSPVPDEEPIRYDDESHHFYKVWCKWQNPSTGKEESHLYLER